MNTISATKARNMFFELINRVMYKGEEFIVEKDGKPAVKVLPVTVRKSPDEVKQILADVRGVFAKSAKRKYWSVLDAPSWKRRERKYLKNLSKGIVD